jgi:hypothetical protein
MGNAICQHHGQKETKAGSGITAGGPVNGRHAQDQPTTAAGMPELGLHVDTSTPRHDNELKHQRVEHTPLGAEKETFKFYCPLCMCYSTDILATTCCKNYTCRHCEAQILQYVQAKSPMVACPHCASVGFRLETVSPDSPPRDYCGTPREQPHQREHNSPLKIGDSFDALKRKMLTFEDNP